MNFISSTNELIRLVRQVLLEQSELQQEFVKNSLSVFGSNVDKRVQDEIFESLDKDDLLLLFELRSQENDNVNISQTIDNDTIVQYKAYKFHVIIYGDKAEDKANQIISRLRTEKVRNELQTSNIYLESVSNSSTLNDFINEVMWLRSDFDIYVDCKFNVSQINQDLDFEKFYVYIDSDS